MGAIDEIRWIGGMVLIKPGKVTSAVLLESTPDFCQGRSRMLHLPFHPHQSPGDLVLRSLWKLPFSPLVRVPTSARAAHRYVIGMSGKGRSR